MLERLSNVIYWGLSACGLLVAGLGAFLLLAEPNKNGAIPVTVAFLAFGALLWLVGRAARYILAGK